MANDYDLFLSESPLAAYAAELRLAARKVSELERSTRYFGIELDSYQLRQVSNSVSANTGSF